jgi:hypothetical protein
MAPRVLEHPGTRPTERVFTVDEARVHPEVLAGDLFVAAAHYQGDRLCICNSGWVTIGQVVLDPETGEETEEYALYLCRCSKACKMKPGKKSHV